MFLKAAGQRTGEIAGESSDKRFPNQIDIVDWRWEMTAPSAVGGARTARTQMGELKLVKYADKASTALMSVMRSNELLSTAVLSIRKAGGTEPLPFYVVTLSQARITSFSVQSGLSDQGAPTLIENLSLSFKKVTIDYTVQNAEGAGQGAFSFTGEAAPE